MLSNILAATLRNLWRNGLYSAISILSLAIGLAAALIAGLVVRNQLTYDRFIPGHDRLYLAATVMNPPGVSPEIYPLVLRATPDLMKQEFAGIEAFTRLADEEADLQNGQVAAREKIYWADPNAFDLLQLPVFSGDLSRALSRPDGIVLPRSTARKYFGRDDAVGQTIQLNMHPMTVAAVIQDLPFNGTHLETGIFASALASHASGRIGRPSAADLASFVANRNALGPISLDVQAYFRLAPGASIERIREGMPAFLERTHPPVPIRPSTELLRLDEIHMSPWFNPNIRERLALGALIGVLVVFVAAINFVNLSTARSARRAVEVGIRKTTGARRKILIVQFIGESLVCVAIAMIMAIALTELTLPHANAFLNSGAVLDYRADLGWLGLAVIVVGVVAGAYPALVLSAFKPRTVFSGLIRHASSTGVVRQTLVTLQFAMLIGLLVAVAVVHRQREYATQDALRVDTDQVLIVRMITTRALATCEGALKTELLRLAGVRAVACTTGGFLSGKAFGNVRLPSGTDLPVDMLGNVRPPNGAAFPANMNGVEAGTFALYGLKPVSGRFFEADESPATARVINETAVRRLGFSSPQQAVGQTIAFPPPGLGGPPAEIVGVVPDFSFASVEQEIEPAIYSNETMPRRLELMHIKLAGQQIPETLAEIDRLWAETSMGRPIERFFVDEHFQNLYLSILRQIQIFAVFASLAVLLACLGLVGLASSTTERRTKEIGIRKATGASSADILRLLNWEFAKPVLLANLIAWPIAYLAMQRWLEGFAYRIDLELWMFAAAGAVALAIALTTVSIHSWLVARAKPVTALRYE